MRFTKNSNIRITSVFERNLTLRVARCSRNYSLLVYNGTGVFLQEDEYVPSVSSSLTKASLCYESCQALPREDASV